jgi:FG-GAP repeat
MRGIVSVGRALRLGACGVTVAGLVTIGLGAPAFASGDSPVAPTADSPFGNLKPFHRIPKSEVKPAPQGDARKAAPKVKPSTTDGTAKTDAVATPKRTDFNGDGYNDLATSAPDATISGQDGAGALVVSYGSASGISPTKNTVISQATAGVPGSPEAGDSFGSTLAFGDFNADGYDDIAVGAYHEKGTTDVEGGTVAILWGSANGLNGGTTISDRQADSHENFGKSLAAGDFNGDGKTDLAIGSTGVTVDLYLGGFTPSGTVGAFDSFPAPIQAGPDLGAESLTAGDTNGDGVDDLVVNGYENDSDIGFNANYVALGVAGGGMSATDITKLPGGFLSSIGDLNGDGYGDVVIGMSFEPGDGTDDDPTIPGSVKGGTILVVNGSATGPGSAVSYAIDQDSPGVPGASEAGDAFGSDETLGDINADGHLDAVVGVPDENVNGVDFAGASIVLYGTANGLSGTGSQSFHEDTAGVPGSVETNDFLGTDVKLTDLNGDGHADLTDGVPGENDFNGELLALPSNGTTITATGSLSISTTAAGVPTAGQPVFGLNFAD